MERIKCYSTWITDHSWAEHEAAWRLVDHGGGWMSTGAATIEYYVPERLESFFLLILTGATYKSTKDWIK